MFRFRVDDQSGDALLPCLATMTTRRTNVIEGSPIETFGCGRCWPDSAQDAWVAKASSTIKTFLIDEAHYIVSIWLCGTCQQHFLNVTTELVDWEGGDDPIYRTFMPITPLELVELIESGPPSEDALNAIGIGRRCLKFDWPKDEPSTEYWSTGILVGPHG